MTYETKKDLLDALYAMREAYAVIAGNLFEEDCHEELDKAFNDSWATEIYSKVFARSFDEIPLVDWCIRMEDAIKSAPIIYTAYAPENDMTFIVKETMPNEDGEYDIECVGLYCGEPDAEATKMYMNLGKHLDGTR